MSNKPNYSLFIILEKPIEVLSGWLSVLAGPINYLQSSIYTIKEMANKANKDASKFRTRIVGGSCLSVASN